MMLEGTGLVAPKPVPVILARGEVILLREAADERAAYRRYGSRGDAWGKGFYADPAFPIFMGLLGELAFCHYLNAELPLQGADAKGVDTVLRPRGDGGVDFTVFGARFQLKTRKDRGECLLRRADADGRIVPFGWDAFVAAFWQFRVAASPERSTGPQPYLFAFADMQPDCVPPETRVELDGWMRPEEARAALLQPARRGDHKNLTPLDKHLLPMADLVALLNSRRLAKG